MQRHDIRHWPKRGRGAQALGHPAHGGVSVEYALCMLLAALMLQGVFQLFSVMSLNIVRNFMDWITRPYP